MPPRQSPGFAPTAVPRSPPIKVEPPDQLSQWATFAELEDMAAQLVVNKLTKGKDPQMKVWSLRRFMTMPSTFRQGPEQSQRIQKALNDMAARCAQPMRLTAAPLSPPKGKYVPHVDWLPGHHPAQAHKAYTHVLPLQYT